MMESKSGKMDFYENQEIDDNDLEKLTSMGFDKKAATNALSVCDNFDEALQHLFDNPPPSPRRAATPPTPKQPNFSMDETINSTNYKKASAARRNSKDLVHAQSNPNAQGADGGPANDSERNLDYMFRRRDTLGKEIVEQRKLVVNFSKPPFRISDDTLEELYLFLKEIVHNGKDLDKQKERIHSYVFSRIHSTHGKIVPCLLELMLLENEDYLLQRNISRLLNGESGGNGGDGEDGGDGGDNDNDNANDQADVANEANGPDVDMAKLDELHKNHERDLKNVMAALESEAERQRRKLQQQLRNKRKNKLKECRDNNLLDEEINRVDRSMSENNDLELSRFDLQSSQRNRNIISGIKKTNVKVIEEFSNGNSNGLGEEEVSERSERALTKTRNIYEPLLNQPTQFVFAPSSLGAARNETCG